MMKQKSLLLLLIMHSSNSSPMARPTVHEGMHPYQSRLALRVEEQGNINQSLANKAKLAVSYRKWFDNIDAYASICSFDKKMGTAFLLATAGSSLVSYYYPCLLTLSTTFFFSGETFSSYSRAALIQYYLLPKTINSGNPYTSNPLTPKLALLLKQNIATIATNSRARVAIESILDKPLKSATDQ